MIFTKEQEAIINSEGNIKVNAVAGSGKSSTLVEYAKRRPDEKMLYLVFNKSAKLDAQDKFKTARVSDVDIQTAHSLAYKKIVQLYGYRVTNGLNAYDVKNILNLGGVGYYGFIIASHIVNYMELYFNSIAEEPDEVKEQYVIGLSGEAKEFYTDNDEVILHGVCEIIKRMKEGVIDVTHSFYLKEYQLSDPKLNYDCILYDEMQDSNKVMVDIFIKQKCRKVCVGDDNQQIYSWRGATNVLNQIDFKELTLTNSFRFNQDIANIAMKCLDMKKIANPQFKRFNIYGTNESNIEEGTIAVLARTNLSLLAEAIEVISMGNINRIYFEGNINSYTFMNGVSVYDVFNLYHGNRDYIRNPLIKMMKSVKDLEDYIKKTEDNNLAMLVKIVKKYGRSLPSLFKKLKDMNLPDERKCDAQMIFSTIHKSKGLEYDTVKLMDDFIKLSEIKDAVSKGNFKYNTLSEEVNVLYVAITRVKNKLMLSEGMEFLNEQ